MKSRKNYIRKNKRKNIKNTRRNIKTSNRSGMRGGTVMEKMTTKDGEPKKYKQGGYSSPLVSDVIWTQQIDDRFNFDNLEVYKSIDSNKNIFYKTLNTKNNPHVWVDIPHDEIKKLEKVNQDVESCGKDFAVCPIFSGEIKNAKTEEPTVAPASEAPVAEPTVGGWLGGWVSLENKDRLS